MMGGVGGNFQLSCGSFPKQSIQARGEVKRMGGGWVHVQASVANM